MKKFLKILFGVLGALVLLFVIAALVLPRIYDTEKIKATASEAVKKQTGRDLVIDGDLNFSVFPTLALEINDVSLSNAEGFADTPFAAIGQASVGVAFMPLLRRELVADEVVLKGLRLHLEVDSQGTSNWEDLAEPGGESAPSGGVPELASQQIAGLNIEDAEIEIRDAAANTHYRLSEFDLRTGALGNDGPIPLEISMALEDLVARSRMDVELSAVATLDLAGRSYILDNLDLDATTHSEDGPGETLSVQAPRLLADLSAGTLSMGAFTANVAGVEANGNFNARDINDSPKFNGTLTTGEFSARQAIERLTGEPFPTADPDALQRLSFASDFEGTDQRVRFDKLVMELDSSRLEGFMAVRNFEAPLIKFEFDVDAIDLDRYMAPAEEGSSGGGGDEDVAIPADSLDGMNVDGTLRVASLQLMGFELTQAEMGLRVKDNALRLHPFKAGFYGGQYSGDIRLDASSGTPVISANESIESVIFQQLAGDLMGQDSVSGEALGRLKVTGTGNTVNEVLGSLSGDLALRLDEGALEGIDVWYEIRKAIALVKGQPAPEENAGRTVFSRMELESVINSGVLQTEKLVGELPFLKINGDGAIDLNQMNVDLGLVAAVRDVPELSQDPLAADLKGRSVPFRISGPLTQPQVGVDVENLLKGEATNLLLDKLGLTGGADENAGEGGEEGEASNDDRVRGLIGGILGASQSQEESKSEDDDDGG